MPPRAKPRRYAISDAEKWAVESFVHLSTMQRVLDGGDLSGRASLRAYRYLEAHSFLHFVSGKNGRTPDGKPNVE